MKTGSFTPKPGDLFTWHYDIDNSLCYKNDQIWSSIMKCYVPCAGTNLLISLTETNTWWLNEGRFIHARIKLKSIS